MKIDFVFKNPTDKLKQELVNALSGIAKLNFWSTEYAGHVYEIVHEISLSGTDFLIAVGGDGTFSEVVNAYMKCKAENCKINVIGLLPFGTGNDFARTFNLELNIQKFVQSLVNPNIQLLDVIEVEYVSYKGVSDFKYCINITDFGIGPEVILKVGKSKKRLGSSFAFFSSIVTTFLSYKKKNVRLKYDNFTVEKPMLTLAVANAKYYGGGIGIAPHANPSDGLINITLVANVNLFTYFRKMPILKKCIPIEHPEIFYYTAKECEVHGTTEPLIVDIDGEVLGHTPARFRIMESAIPFFVH